MDFVISWFLYNIMYEVSFVSDIIVKKVFRCDLMYDFLYYFWKGEVMFWLGVISF